ncbi:MAG: putative 15 [Tardiphaga sp.]|jgi:nitrogenase-associated protein|nr:putative 15 [Tardiphaga sp.]
MATVTFYHKPGCRTNARQKQLLEAAGHRVIARDLISEPWTATDLRSYFGVAPITSWFNPAAPRIKSGEIAPASLDADAALAVMLDDHLLIRRPLVEAMNQRCAGFDGAIVTELLGATTDKGSEACSRSPGSESCPDPNRLSSP